MYRQFSNFFPAPVTVFVPVLGKEREFKTSEHAFQAGKATTADDVQRVADARTPAAAKLAGRKIRMSPSWEAPYDAKKWSVTHQEDVEALSTAAGHQGVVTQNRDFWMWVVLRRKFAKTKDNARADVLLGTGNAPLVEHTTKDEYWADGGDPTGNKGQNKLGKLLVLVRTEMRRQHQDKPGEHAGSGS